MARFQVNKEHHKRPLSVQMCCNLTVGQITTLGFAETILTSFQEETKKLLIGFY